MTSNKVLLIGWDAADWKAIQPLMDAGKMPNVQRLVENGVRGQIATLHPPLSPMLWTSIATGQRPFKHGIHGFSEPTPDGRGVQPISSLSRKSKALWNIFHQNDLRSIVIGWWPSHPVEPINGVMVSDRYHRANGPLQNGWRMPAATVHPPELAATLAGLRVHPEQLNPEIVEQFVPLAREIDQDLDKRLALLLRTIAECMTIQAAASWLIEHQKWDFFAVYFDAIDHFCHGFMRYHPPRQSWIDERDFELYSNVVSMAYRYHDRMLGDLLSKVSEETTVILMSDHGFHPDHLRPASIPDIPAGPAIEHRDLGVLAMSGPGIRRKAPVYGASLLDIAPTILTLCGLPVGEDMDGKVLTEAFVDTPEISFIASWEDVPGADGSHAADVRLDPLGGHAAIQQMIALGYIERPDENREVAVRKTVRELRYNLGEAYQDAGRHRDALEIFRELRAADPDESRYALRLFVSCQALGLLDDMREIAGQARPPAVDYLNAQLLIAERRYADALAALERLLDAHPNHPGLLLQTADLHFRLRRSRQTQQLFARVLTIDPDHPQAHLGLCRVALRRRNYGLAAHSALDAVQRVHHDPEAHFLLGEALAGMKEYTESAAAFRTAISLNPNFPEAHLRLARMLEKHLNGPESAREHRRLARRMSGKTWKKPKLVGRAGPPARTSYEEILPFASNLTDSLVIVTGLPRSGTSMLMQMLFAGGLQVVSDGFREPDADNPRGYFEFAAVKNLLNDSDWLWAEKGRAIKIVAPLLSALPPGLPCRIIFCERDLDEVLDSQQHMLLRRGQDPVQTAGRRDILKAEFARIVTQAKATLAKRPRTELFVINHAAAISDPVHTAEVLNRFLGGGLDRDKMTAAIDAALHRNRRPAYT